MRTTTQELRADTWSDYLGHLASGGDARLVAVEVMRELPCEQCNGAQRRLRDLGNHVSGRRG